MLTRCIVSLRDLLAQPPVGSSHVNMFFFFLLVAHSGTQLVAENHLVFQIQHKNVTENGKKSGEKLVPMLLS